MLRTLLTLAAVAQAPPTVAPGDARIDGAALAEYEATWDLASLQNAGAPTQTVSEVLTRHPDRWVRVQTTRQGRLTIVVEVTLDRASLRPISLRRSLGPDTPEQLYDRLIQNGFKKTIDVDFREREYTIRATDFDGEVSETEGSMGVPFFDGSTLGLVVAALRLRPGETARLPVLFLNGRAGDVTHYWVDAEAIDVGNVVGIEATRVDVGWLDFDSEALTSEPGPDAAGGAYWVTPTFGAGHPPVPRYKNESVDIVLKARTRQEEGS